MAYVLIGLAWIGLLIYCNEVVSKFYGHIDQSNSAVGIINVIWCDIDKDGKYYALAEDWDTGTRTIRFGDSPEQAQNNARKELKKILNDAIFCA